MKLTLGGLQSLFGQQSKIQSNGESLSYQGQKKLKNKNENNNSTTTAAATTTTTADLMLKGPVVVDSFVFDTAANKYNPMGKAGNTLFSYI